ncbi:replication-associated recombination protein A [bacterium]|nr:replication-associated recombination protein A [bacterium]
MPRATDTQPSLFGTPSAASGAPVADAPLAERMRPTTLAEFVGQTHLVGDQRLLRDMIEGQRLHSLILWGPPGTGKTSLARLIARSTDAHFIAFSAVLSGVKELRAVVEEARRIRQHQGRRAILFVDEIHRFNKAQQDAFLPHVEDGTIVLIGATTENPSFEIIAPLLSRASVLVLQPLAADDLRIILRRATTDTERGLGGRGLQVEDDAIEALVQLAQGDARAALNILETAADLLGLRHRSTMTAADIEEAAQRRALRYDKGGDEHYNVASAFIKSLRGSDPDAALYWMLRMLEAGDDPLFVARRMVIFAAEDIGLADPWALALATAAKEAVEFVGLPEGRIPLAEAVVYLATAPKSNTAYAAMLAAADDVRDRGPLPVPLHLRNAPTRLMRDLGYGKGYEYAHAQPDHAVGHHHLPDELRDRRYYEPGDNAVERAIAERLAAIGRRRHGG